MMPNPNPDPPSLEYRHAAALCAAWGCDPGTAWRSPREPLPALPPGSRLCLAVAGPLARALPEWGDPRFHTGGLLRALVRLGRAGYAVEAVAGVHGPAGLAWGLAFRALERLGRPDLADRALARSRAAYVARGPGALLAPVRLVRARRR